MRTLRSMDSPWRRLPWTLPAALLIWAAALWGSAYFMYEPTYRPAEPPPIDAQLIELPAPVATGPSSRDRLPPWNSPNRRPRSCRGRSP